MKDLIEKNIMTLNKPDLQEFARQLQDALKNETSTNSSCMNSILMRLDGLEKSREKDAQEIIELRCQNRKLIRRINELERDLDDFDERFIDIEKNVLNVQQYIRRENLEISGIPEEIEQNNLEDKVLEYINENFDEDDDKLTKRDLQACHRLGQKGQKNKVIVRMVNRKDAIKVLKNRKKINEKCSEKGIQNVYIEENLANETKRILETGKNLKKNKLLHSCWTFNGVFNFKKSEHGKVHKLFHISEFESYFSSKELGWD